MNLQTTKASAPMRPERHGPLHGRRRQPRQHRCFVRPRVRRGAVVVAIPESPAIEQALDPRLHGGQHLRHVQGGEARDGVKSSWKAGPPDAVRRAACQRETRRNRPESEGRLRPDGSFCGPECPTNSRFGCWVRASRPDAVKAVREKSSVPEQSQAGKYSEPEQTSQRVRARNPRTMTGTSRCSTSAA